MPDRNFTFKFQLDCTIHDSFLIPDNMKRDTQTKVDERFMHKQNEH